MSEIWFGKVDLAALNAPKEDINTLLDVRIEDYGDDWITASMPVDKRTHQPYGILHGGASVVLAESLGSIASYLCIDSSRFYCVGLEVNANHLKAVKSGRVTAIAKPVHLGRTTHVWDIRLSNEEGTLTCISRLTMAVVPVKAA
ncbi:hotdog fold thioesterase [Pseudomonas neustonica]|uniref:Hotdog fold thioesterase n=1 Tax=Pseudomonas neustonica TaxID=2487346 RepID=A0ABX9XIC9_9PSED|nr:MULTISPECIES: hotdog fold thioesterase [Pseudomonas]ROZ80495.1 hotdog fold thioesterase [Pseudomonas sp. SSM44]ROZ81680.1 hotdog fold thioesterase [Pseudomonas neustonica]|tara:strand:+ start:1327 stop:1758 length:432 start_codon:yes stop_codon:yes gene_type:complete